MRQKVCDNGNCGATLEIDRYGDPVDKEDVDNAWYEVNREAVTVVNEDTGVVNVIQEDVSYEFCSTECLVAMME